MSDEGPSAPPFFRPAAPKRSEKVGTVAEAAPSVGRAEPAVVGNGPDLSDRAPPGTPLSAPKRKGRPPLHNVTWTDAMRVYKLLSSFPREMQQVIIEAVQNDD